MAPFLRRSRQPRLGWLCLWLQLCFQTLLAYRHEQSSRGKFTPAEHKKLIWSELVEPYCRARKLDKAYKSGVGEPDDVSLQYKGSGAEMKVQAKDQFIHYAFGDLFGKKSKDRPVGVNPITAARAVAQHFHASPPPLCFEGCGDLLEASAVKADENYASEAVAMLEIVYADNPDNPTYPATYPHDKAGWWFGNGGEMIRKYIPEMYQPRGLVTNRQFRNQLMIQTQQLFCNAFSSSPEYFWRRAGNIMHMLTDAYSNSHVIRRKDAKFNKTDLPDTLVDVFMTMDGELWDQHVRADSPMAKKVMGGSETTDGDWQRLSAKWMAKEATTQLIKAFLGVYDDGTGGTTCLDKPKKSGAELQEYVEEHLAGFLKVIVCEAVAKMDKAMLSLPAGGVWTPRPGPKVDFKYSSVKTPNKGKSIPWVPIGVGTAADLQEWVDSVNSDLEPIRKVHTDNARRAFAFASDSKDYCALDSTGEKLTEVFSCQTTDFESEDSVAYIDMAKQTQEKFVGGPWMTDLANVKNLHQEG